MLFQLGFSVFEIHLIGVMNDRRFFVELSGHRQSQKINGRLSFKRKRRKREREREKVRRNREENEE
jgi:hypothetical protein